MDGDEDHRARLAGFRLDLLNGRGFLGLVAHPNRRKKPASAPRPHAAGKFDRRQEAAPLGMSVGSDFRHRDELEEIKPVEHARQN